MRGARGRAVERLASLHGVALSYRSVRTGRTERASRETLVAVLRGLGSPMETESDAADALRERERILAGRLLPTTVVAWDGVLPRLEALEGARRPADLFVETEDGGTIRWEPRRRAPGPLPPGVHRLRARSGRKEGEASVLSAPRRLGPARRETRRGWGTFLPLYAARSDRDWGCGGLAELEALAALTRERGGTLVATLPLFATFLATPFDPSPYAPVSRLYWNEQYLDLTSLPEFERSERARRLASAASGETATLRAARHVDWKRAAAARRPVLEALAAQLFEGGGEARRRFESHVASDPHLLAYARFRAAREGAGAESAALAERVHLYAQWRFEESFGGLGRRLRERGTSLYLDLPLGVHAEGFDPFRFPEVFARGVSGGAPPDLYSARGQDWGFPPVHPERGRAGGHAYFRECLRRILRHAAILRIDHVMSLHRLWWVPRGFPASAGAYVRYPAEELYAALSLEASRAGATIVGEDLGTVPPTVRPAMRRHGLLRTWAVQRELASDPAGAFAGVPAASAASLNTHDHPTFAGWWEGNDIEDRAKLGLLEPEGVRRETARRKRARKALGKRVGSSRAPKSPPAREALLALGATRAEWVVVNLEDLWGERRPQNVPGTTDERPNWRRKARYDLDRIARSRTVRETLAALDEARRGKERS